MYTQIYSIFPEVLWSLSRRFLFGKSLSTISCLVTMHLKRCCLARFAARRYGIPKFLPSTIRPTCLGCTWRWCRTWDPVAKPTRLPVDGLVSALVH